LVSIPGFDCWLYTFFAYGADMAPQDADRVNAAAGRDPEQTRLDILHATMSAIAKKGDAGVRVAKVAKAAGVTTGAIYSRFGSREGLLAAAHTEFMHEMVAEIIGSLGGILDSVEGNPLTSPQYAEVMRGAFMGAQAENALRWAAAASRAQHQPDLAAQLQPIERGMLDGITSIIQRGQTDGWMRPDIDPRAIAVIIFGGVIGMSVMSRVYADVPEFLDNAVEAWPYVPKAFAPVTS
jgi:AcrR family transcriptional regulator